MSRTVHRAVVCVCATQAKARSAAMQARKLGLTATPTSRTAYHGHPINGWYSFAILPSGSNEARTEDVAHNASIAAWRNWMVKNQPGTSWANVEFGDREPMVTDQNHEHQRVRQDSEAGAVDAGNKTATRSKAKRKAAAPKPPPEDTHSEAVGQAAGADDGVRDTASAVPATESVVPGDREAASDGGTSHPGPCGCAPDGQSVLAGGECGGASVDPRAPGAGSSARVVGAEWRVGKTAFVKTGRYAYRPVRIIDALEFPYTMEPNLRLVKVRHTQGVKTGKAEWLAVSALHECEPKREPSERAKRIKERQDNGRESLISALAQRNGKATVSELVRAGVACGYAIWGRACWLERQGKLNITPDESKTKQSKWVLNLT